jgi:hypothetical protein
MSNSEELAIEVENLSFNLGGAPILENVNLQLHNGSRCLLVGKFETKQKIYFLKLLAFVMIYFLIFRCQWSWKIHFVNNNSGEKNDPR